MFEPDPYRKILLAGKDTNSCLNAVNIIVKLVAAGGEVLVLHVVHPKEYLDYAARHLYDRPAPLPVEALLTFREPFDPVLERLAGAGVQAQLYVETGESGSKICQIARDEQVDLLVLTRPRTGSWRGALGISTSTYVFRHSACSLLAIPN